MHSFLSYSLTLLFGQWAEWCEADRRWRWRGTRKDAGGATSYPLPLIASLSLLELVLAALVLGHLQGNPLVLKGLTWPILSFPFSKPLNLHGPPQDVVAAILAGLFRWGGGCYWGMDVPQRLEPVPDTPKMLLSEISGENTFFCK